LAPRLAEVCREILYWELVMVDCYAQTLRPALAAVGSCGLLRHLAPLVVDCYPQTLRPAVAAVGSCGLLQHLAPLVVDCYAQTLRQVSMEVVDDALPFLTGEVGVVSDDPPYRPRVARVADDGPFPRRPVVQVAVGG